MLKFRSNLGLSCLMACGHSLACKMSGARGKNIVLHEMLYKVDGSVRVIGLGRQFITREDTMFKREGIRYNDLQQSEI